MPSSFSPYRWLESAAADSIQTKVRAVCEACGQLSLVEIIELVRYEFSDVLPEGIVISPEKPERTPVDRWESLPECSKALTLVRSAMRNLFQAAPPSFSTLLKNVYDGLHVDENAARVLEAICASSPYLDKNPTRDSVVEYVANVTKQEQPLRFVLTQCIQRPSEYRLQQFMSLTSGATAGAVKFCKGIEQYGWESLSRILSAAGDRAEATIFLGDGDYFTIDQCDRWCTDEQLSMLQDETRALQRDIQQQADVFFEGKNVTVRRWMDEGLREASAEEMKNAAAVLPDNREFMKISRKPYRQLWGYPGYAKKAGLPGAALDAYIDSDIFRTAASYRVEARRVRDMGAIQCWAERSARPFWGMEISNYDQTGIPPSLVLQPFLP